MIVKYLPVFFLFVILSATHGQEFKPVKPRSLDEMQFLSTNPFRKLVNTTGPAGQVTKPVGSFALVGVVNREEQDFAWLKDKKTGKVFKAEKGVEKNGVTLVAVAHGRVNQETFVTVSGASGEFEVYFDIEAKKKPVGGRPTFTQQRGGDKKPAKPPALNMNKDGNGTLRLGGGGQKK